VTHTFSIWEFNGLNFDHNSTVAAYILPDSQTPSFYRLTGEMRKIKENPVKDSQYLD
jgi:hypothetical protein